jgi:hypothetical protein
LPNETFDPKDFRYWLLRQTRLADSAHYWKYEVPLSTPSGQTRLIVRHSKPSHSGTEHAQFVQMDRQGKPVEIGRVKFTNRAWSEIELNTEHPRHADLLKALVHFVQTPNTGST